MWPIPRALSFFEQQNCACKQGAPIALKYETAALRHSTGLMTASGHKQTNRHHEVMSALCQ